MVRSNEELGGEGWWCEAGGEGWGYKARRNREERGGGVKDRGSVCPWVRRGGSWSAHEVPVKRVMIKRLTFLFEGLMLFWWRYFAHCHLEGYSVKFLSVEFSGLLIILLISGW